MATYNITVTSPGFFYRFSGSDRNGTINSSTNNPTINVNTGDTINFTFNTTSNHPIDILSIGVNNAHSGTTASYTFSSAMTHTYICDIHGSSMSGSIIASSATTTTTTTTSSTTTTTTSSTTTTTTTTTTQAPDNTTTTTTTDAPDDTTTTTTTDAPDDTTTTTTTNVPDDTTPTTTTDAPDDTTTTNAPSFTTTTFAPINDDGDPVWNGDYHYFIYVYQSGSTMPPGISGGFTRSGSPSFLNRNNFFDTWIPDALHYRNVELQWQIAGTNVSRRQGWENRGNPETRAIAYDSLERAQYSNTILPEDYEPRGGVEVGGTSAGCIEIERLTLADSDSPDTLLFTIGGMYFWDAHAVSYLSVIVLGNWLTHDVVCPPEDPEEWVATYDSKSAGYALTATYDFRTSTSTNNSISRVVGPSSLPESDPNHLINGDLIGEGQLLYTPSVCLGEHQSKQTLNAILRIRPQALQHYGSGFVGQLETYYSSIYSKSVEVSLSSHGSVTLSWGIPKELEIIYDYTDSEWYMAHIHKDRAIREKYEYYGDDKYEIYGYEFQWISNKPDETGWHHWFKITGDDILPTDQYKDASGNWQSRDLLYAGSESGEDLGYTRTVVVGRDGNLHRGGLQLELSFTNSDIGGKTGQLQPGLGFVRGVAEEHQICGGVTEYETYQYKFRVRAIYRCNRTTHRSKRVIMPDGTYDFVPVATILLASSEYHPYKSTDPLPVANTEKGHPFGVSFRTNREGSTVLPSAYVGKANMKSYDVDAETDDGTRLLDNILDPLNQTPTTTTTPEPEYPIE